MPAERAAQDPAASDSAASDSAAGDPAEEDPAEEDPAARGTPGSARAAGDRAQVQRAARLAAGCAGADPSVPPGTGWPEDPATASTPVARDPAAVRELAASAGSLAELAARESVCRACPRLVSWREEVAVTRRRAYATERYWGRPVAGWGDERPRVLILGLAPAAHGGNRTGRVFTGDRSGDVLFASLWRCGLAALPTSVSAGDGQRLLGARMAAAVRCAPPANKPRAGRAGRLRALARGGTRAERAVAAGGGLPWRVRLASALAAVDGRRRHSAPPPSGIRSRHTGHGGLAVSPRRAAAGQRRFRAPGRFRTHGAFRSAIGFRPAAGGAGARLLPPEPAEHLHRAGHRPDAGRGIHGGAAGSRPVAGRVAAPGAGTRVSHQR